MKTGLLETKGKIEGIEISVKMPILYSLTLKEGIRIDYEEDIFDSFNSDEIIEFFEKECIFVVSKQIDKTPILKLLKRKVITVDRLKPEEIEKIEKLKKKDIIDSIKDLFSMDEFSTLREWAIDRFHLGTYNLEEFDKNNTMATIAFYDYIYHNYEIDLYDYFKIEELLEEFEKNNWIL